MSTNFTKKQRDDHMFIFILQSLTNDSSGSILFYSILFLCFFYS